MLLWFVCWVYVCEGVVFLSLGAFRDSQHLCFTVPPVTSSVPHCPDCLGEQQSVEKQTHAVGRGIDVETQGVNT